VAENTLPSKFLDEIFLLSPLTRTEMLLDLDSKEETSRLDVSLSAATDSLASRFAAKRSIGDLKNTPWIGGSREESGGRGKPCDCTGTTVDSRS
jgi:hypothetical protein